MYTLVAEERDRDRGGEGERGGREEGEAEDLGMHQFVDEQQFTPTLVLHFVKLNKIPF